jgi:hypothetical protein
VRALVILGLLVGVLQAGEGYPCGSIIVPTSAGVALQDAGERRCLETLFGEPIPDAIAHGFIAPGQTIDFSNPAVNFVYSYQSWYERRVAMIRSFGPTAPNILLDVQELERWDRLREAWREFERAVEKGRPKAR